MLSFTETKMAEKKEKNSVEVEIPQNVEVTVEGKKVTVSGEKGSVARQFKNPTLAFSKKDKSLNIRIKSSKKRDLACLGTVRGHIKNMIDGVNSGVTYNLRIVYAHFPMTVSVSGNQVLINNFLGEKSPRRAEIIEGVQVSVKGQDVTVTGVSLESVSQTAANIEQATRIKDLDPRVFQDGIYMTVKNGKPIK